LIALKTNDDLKIPSFWCWRHCRLRQSILV
jgi:hypothetical protein